MKDYQTQWEQVTNTCVKCGEEFTESRPCCCDDGLFERDGETRHTDGICVVCCEHKFHR